MSIQEKVFQVKQANPDWGYTRIARALNMHINTVRYHLSRAYKSGLYSRAPRKHYLSKAECVSLLGGKCCKCGYDKHIDALDFHHIDPSLKTFNLGRAFSIKMNPDLVLAELKNCELLCANCHRIEHAKRRKEK